jgi:tetratricopeptide (TPR) repeat protein
MRKTLFFFTTISLFTIICPAQTAKKAVFFCGYGEGDRGMELCAKIQEESFVSNEHAEKAVDMILKPLGLRRNFVLVSCPNINNAKAVTYGDGIRYIVYDNAFMEQIDRGSNTDWASVSILAHEIGHHLQGHTLRPVSPQQRRENELEADEFSGFAMFKIGATLSQAQAAMRASDDVADEESSTHPKKWRRLAAIKTGYENARSQERVKNIDNHPSAESFFDTGRMFFFFSSYPEAIENFTAAIALNSEYRAAFSYRGQAKYETGDYRGAVNDYNRALKIEMKGATLNNRGRAYLRLGDRKNACGDFFLGCFYGSDVACKNNTQLCSSN